jgi:cyclase
MTSCLSVSDAIEELPGCPYCGVLAPLASSDHYTTELGNYHIVSSIRYPLRDELLGETYRVRETIRLLAAGIWRAVSDEARGIEEAIMVKRGLIVARIKPGAEEQVAAIFGESDETDLPIMTGVRHRSLFVLEDIYIHLVEMDDDFTRTVDGVREHDLFRDISKKLEPYIQPYNPITWKSPKDATAREFYTWDRPDEG